MNKQVVHNGQNIVAILTNTFWSRKNGSERPKQWKIESTEKHVYENRYIQRDMVVDIRRIEFKPFIPAPRL